MAPHPPQTTRAWVGTTKRWANVPTTRLGSAIVSGGFHGTPGQHYRGINNISAISMPTFHPRAKKRENHFRAKTGATEAVFSRRRAKTHQCGAMRFPNMGNRKGSASSAAHHRRLFSDLQTASTRADCEQSTSPAPTGPRGCQAPHPHLQQQITTMSVERRVASDRRSGKDRRETEAGPPTNFERRRNVEARQPELTELHLSEDELKALGFAPGTPAPQK